MNNGRLNYPPQPDPPEVMQREITRLRAEVEALTASADAWRLAALRIGEEIAHTGPEGYYEFTPTQWQEWALSVGYPRGRRHRLVSELEQACDEIYRLRAELQDYRVLAGPVIVGQVTKMERVRDAAQAVSDTLRREDAEAGTVVTFPALEKMRAALDAAKSEVG